MESDLAAFDPPQGAAPSWIEVTVETSDAGENLFELTRELAEARRPEFEVVRVQVRRERSAATLRESDAAEFHDVDALLDDPSEVFNRRLSMASDLPAAQVEELRIAFRELYQVHLDRERGSDPEPSTIEETEAKETKAPGDPDAPVAKAPTVPTVGNRRNAL